jgi:hypothetical protein
LAFLHKLFDPTPNDEVGRLHNFELDSSYRAFHRYSNGVTLFDNTLFIYGIVDEISRTADINMVQPVSLGAKLSIPSLYHDAVEVGALAAATKSYSIFINSCGRTFVVDKDFRLDFVTFCEAVLALVETCDGLCSDEGLLDPSGMELQNVVDRLLRRGKPAL